MFYIYMMGYYAAIKNAVVNCSVIKPYLTLCNPMNCSKPGFPVLYYLPEFVQTHVQRIRAAIEPYSTTRFCSCPQSFPASGSFPMSQLFSSGGQSTGVSASASVLPELISFRITGLISLLSKGLSSITNEKESIVWHSAFFMVQLFTSIHDYWKNHSFDYMVLYQQSDGSDFNMLSRFIIVFLPRSKHLNFVAAVTIPSDFGAQENKICHYFHFFPIYSP